MKKILLLYRWIRRPESQERNMLDEDEGGERLVSPIR
jgi:hypothetical protein